MAVDSMQVDSKPFALAFTGKSKSAEHVSIRTSLVEDGHAPSPSGSELTCHEEQQAIEKLRVARKTLEDEIEVGHYSLVSNINSLRLYRVGLSTDFYK